MACKWTYKGRVYTETQFIAVIANEMIETPSTGEKIESWEKKLEQKVDEFFKQNTAFSSIVPPDLVKAALKSEAKTVIAGGKIVQAVEHAIKYIHTNVKTPLNEIQNESLRNFLKNELKDGVDQFFHQLAQTQSLEEADKTLLDTMFEGLEQRINEASTKIEVKSVIEDFIRENKGRVANLNNNRILNLFVAAIKADYKNSSKYFLNKANRLLQKQELFDTITQAEERQTQALKNIGKFTNVKDDINQFLKVNVDDIADISPELLNQYNEALNGLVERGVKDVSKALDLLPELSMIESQLQRRRVTGMNSTISRLETVGDLRNFLNNLIAKGIDDLDGLREFNRNLSMLTTRASELLAYKNQEASELNQEDNTSEFKLKEAEYQNILDFIENELPNALGKNESSKKFREQIEILKQEQLAESFQIKQPNKSFGLRNKAVNEFFSWAKEDLMKLTPAEVLTYAGVREAVTTGYIPPQLYDLNNKVNVLKNTETIISETGDVARSFAGLSKFRQTVSKALSNPIGSASEIKDKLTVRGKQHWDAMFGTEGKRTFWKTVLNPIHQAFTSITKSNAKDLEGLQKSLRELKSFWNKHVSEKNTNDYNRTMSKLGIILAQLDYQSNFVGWDDLPDDKKDLFNYVSNSPQKTERVPVNKLKIDKEAYNELIKSGAVVNGVLNPDIAISKLSDNEQKVLNEFQKTLDLTKEKARLMTEKRGDPFNEQKNYWPRQVISSFNDVEEANSALAAANVATKGAIGTRASATKQRVDKAINYQNFNIEQVAKKHVRQINQDFYLTDEIKRSLGTLKNTAKQLEENGLKEQASQIYGISQAIEDGLRSELSSQYLLDQGGMPYINHVLKAARNLTLSNPVRIATELTSNLIRNASLLPDARDIAWEPILDDLGTSVYLKGNKYMFEAREASSTTLSKVNDFVMQLSDSLAARQMWINEFKSAFKESTGADFDQNQYLIPEYQNNFRQQINDAAQIAEMEVNKNYNAQSGFVAPSKTQITPWSQPVSRENTVAKIFGYMNSFAANEALLSKMALKHFAEGNYYKGGVQLGRLMASNYVFTLLSATAGSALRAAFDDEDDDFKSFIDKTFEPFNAENWEQTMINSAIATVSSMALGRFSNLFRVSSGLVMGFLTESSPENETIQYANNVLKDVFYIKPTILSSTKQDPRNRFDYVMENVAPGLGQGVSDIVEGVGAGAGLTMAYAEDKEFKTSDLLLMAKSGLYVMSLLSGGLPMGAIAKRSINQKVGEAIKEEKEEVAVEKIRQEGIEMNLKGAELNNYIKERMDKRKSSKLRSEYRKELEGYGMNKGKIEEKVNQKYPLD